MSSRPVRVIACLLLACAVSFSPRTGAARADLPRDAAFVKRVNDAVDKGAAWLESAWKAGAIRSDLDEQFPGGLPALLYHTLRVCGVPRENETCAAIYARLKRDYDAARKTKRLRTYAVSVTMLAIADHGDTRTAKDGGPQVALDKSDQAWMKDCVALLEAWQADEGTWWYGRPGTGPDGGPLPRAPRGVSNFAYDHSNTQYALLGLQAASRSGVDVRSRTFQRCLEHLISAQEPEGERTPRFEPGEKGRTSDGVSDRARGWGYVTAAMSDGRGTTFVGTGAYGSMTAGCLGSVVICRSELIGRAGYPQKLDDAAETAAHDGRAWLGLHFDVAHNPAPPGAVPVPQGMPGNDPDVFQLWHYYYLYALERAGRLAGVEFFGEHDWYGEGADHLVAAQRADGAWKDGALLDTCFALLFLRRGTPTVARGALTQALDETSINFEVAKKLGDDDFEDFIDLTLSVWTRATDDARGRIARRSAEVGKRIVWPLLRRLEASDEKKRAAAVGLLRGATGRDFGYDPVKSAKEREDALVAWQAWWLENEPGLAYDAGSGRLVSRSE